MFYNKKIVTKKLSAASDKDEFDERLAVLIADEIEDNPEFTEYPEQWIAPIRNGLEFKPAFDAAQLEIEGLADFMPKVLEYLNLVERSLTLTPDGRFHLPGFESNGRAKGTAVKGTRPIGSSDEYTDTEGSTAACRQNGCLNGDTSVSTKTAISRLKSKGLECLVV